VKPAGVHLKRFAYFTFRPFRLRAAIKVFTFVCGTKDGNDNEYVTMGTKPVCTMCLYIFLVKYKIIFDNPDKCGKKLRILF
jgi:hypothetical protein